MCFADISSKGTTYFLDLSFVTEKCEILMQANLLFFSFVVSILHFLPKKVFTTSRLEIYSFKISSGTFIVLYIRF